MGFAAARGLLKAVEFMVSKNPDLLNDFVDSKRYFSYGALNEPCFSIEKIPPLFVAFSNPDTTIRNAMVKWFLAQPQIKLQTTVKCGWDLPSIFYVTAFDSNAANISLFRTLLKAGMEVLPTQEVERYSHLFIEMIRDEKYDFLKIALETPLDWSKTPNSALRKINEELMFVFYCEQDKKGLTKKEKEVVKTFLHQDLLPEITIQKIFQTWFPEEVSKYQKKTLNEKLPASQKRPIQLRL